MRSTALRCHIRSMQVGDIPQVVDIERESFANMWPQTVYQRELKNQLARYLVAYQPADDNEAGRPVSPEGSSGGGLIKLVRRILGDPPEPTRDRILGVVGLWCMMGQGHIVTIAVRQEHRRLGIGELLLMGVIEAAIEAGQEEITLEYRISNDAARSLYDKYGFSKVGVRARYYSDNQEDAVLMTTPPVRSPSFRRLLSRRIAEQREQWGSDYPLAGQLGELVTPSG